MTQMETCRWWEHAQERTGVGSRLAGLRDAQHGLVPGAGGEEFGVILCDSPLLADARRRRSGADRFEDHGFPVAAPNAYPWPAQIGPKRRMRRPGVRALQHLDSVLRALAASTKSDYDEGRWTRVVVTPDGEIPVTLALPDRVDPPARTARRE